MKIPAKVELAGGGWANCFILQLGESFGQPCAYLTRVDDKWQFLDGKILPVRLEFVRLEPVAKHD